MASADEEHNLITGNLFAALHQAARGILRRPFIKNIKLRLAGKNWFYYPDIILACAPDDDHEYYGNAPAYSLRGYT